MFNRFVEKNNDYVVCSINVETRQLEKIDKIGQSIGVNRSSIFRDTLSFCLQFFDEDCCACSSEEAKEIMKRIIENK